MKLITLIITKENIMELIIWIAVTLYVAIPLYLLLKPKPELRTPIHRVRLTRNYSKNRFSK